MGQTLYDLYDAVTPDTTIQQFNEDEGDIGNWRAVIDGVLCHNINFEDGVPESAPIDLVLDDRDGPVASYDSYSEARYTVGFDIPSHQRTVEAALMAGAATYENFAAANAANVVGLPASVVDITVFTGITDELYLVKIDDAAPTDVDITVERVGFMLVGTGVGAFKMTIYGQDSLVDVTAAALSGPGGVLSCSNRHKGTFVATACDLTILGWMPEIFAYNPTSDYFIEDATGNRKRVDYIDDTLVAGDKCVIVGMAYVYGQLFTANDYQILSRVSRSKRQQLALYRPLSNSSVSPIWIRRLYPDVRLTRQPAESTGTGQNKVNVRRYEYEVFRMRQPTARGDFFIEQHVQAPITP
jgi:hypothetical protein